MKNEFTNLLQIVGEQGELRKKCSDSIKSIRNSDDYTPKAQKELIDDINNFLQKMTTENRTRARDAFNALSDSIKKDTMFNLEAMEDAMKAVDFIKSSGGKIDAATKAALMDGLKGNLHGKKLLAAAFEQFGITHEPLQKQLITPEFELSKLKETLERSFYPGGSMNVISSEIANFASILDVELESVPYIPGEAPEAYMTTITGII